MYESKTEIVIWRIRIGVGSVIRIQVHGWVPPRSRDEPRGTARIAFRLLIGSCVISNSNCFVANITCVPVCRDYSSGGCVSHRISRLSLGSLTSPPDRRGRGDGVHHQHHLALLRVLEHMRTDTGGSLASPLSALWLYLYPLQLFDLCRYRDVAWFIPGIARGLVSTASAVRND